MTCIIFKILKTYLHVAGLAEVEVGEVGEDWRGQVSLQLNLTSCQVLRATPGYT